MLIHQILHLILFQLQVWVLIPAASSPISNPLPSTSLPKHPISSLIFPSNGSLTNPNVLPEDPFYLPWPASGYPQGVVRLYSYTNSISRNDANAVFSSFAEVYYRQSPSAHCGTIRRSYTVDTVTLVLEPEASLTWGIVASSAFTLPMFMEVYEYVGLKFEIMSLSRRMIDARGYIFTGQG